MKRILVVLATLPLLWLNSTGFSDSETSTTGGTDERTSAILALTGDTAAGQTSFEGSCGLGAPSCHNGDGTNTSTSGVGDAADLTEEASSFTDEFIVKTILDGQGSMPPQDTLDDQKIADIVAFIRSEWGGG